MMLVAGARPNFMKIAPIYKELSKYKETIETIIVHTGQHYDENMSGDFFKDLELPNPSYKFERKNSTNIKFITDTMHEFEFVLERDKPDAVIVVGDVDSSLACAQTTQRIRYQDNHKGNISFVSKNKRPMLIHVEAGLRSNDFSMPEEINRIIIDSISDILLASSEDAFEYLKKSVGKNQKVFLVGNTMIDSLVNWTKKSKDTSILNEFNLSKGGYGLVTLHRPSNIDNEDKLKEIMNTLNNLSKKTKIVFPLHPRTLKKLTDLGMDENYPDINFTEPLPYNKFLGLLSNSKFILTDSGGLQEESTFLNLPCLTLRENTERPITISQGTNKLIFPKDIESEINEILSGNGKTGTIPKFWDGKASERITEILIKELSL